MPDCILTRDYGILSPAMRASISTPSGFILLFANPRHISRREKMNGVYAGAISHNWQVQTVDHMPDAAHLRELLSVWSPIGCIVEDGTCQQRIDPRPFGDTPVIMLGRDYHRRRQVFDCIRQSQEDVTAAAMEAFAAHHLNHFAYFSDFESPDWCHEREACFRKHVGNDRTLDVYRRKSAEGVAELRAITNWIQSLPRPCGVLLAADHMATSFFAALRKTGRTAPGDLFIASVDNDEQICRNMRPQLTSVMPDYYIAGFMSVELLAKRIADPKVPPMTEPYGVHSVVHRSSTGGTYANSRVGRAVAFIREHACDGGIAVPDVVRTMGCCRCLAERYFKESTGQTILDCIQTVRFDKAISLLRSPFVMIDSIPGRCGYSSVSHFKAFFKSKTGLTMRDWRRQHIGKARRYA